MILTITFAGENATDLGYLLHKSPFRVHSFEQPFGKTHVFYPEATAQRARLRCSWRSIPLVLCVTGEDLVAKRMCSKST